MKKREAFDFFFFHFGCFSAEHGAPIDSVSSFVTVVPSLREIENEGE